MLEFIWTTGCSKLFTKPEIYALLSNLHTLIKFQCCQSTELPDGYLDQIRHNTIAVPFHL